MWYTFTACNLASSKYPWRSSLSFRSWSGSVTWSRISVVRLTFSSDGKASSIFCITWGWCGKTIVESTWVIWRSHLQKPCAARILQHRLLYTFYGASCSELRQHSKLIPQSSLEKALPWFAKLPGSQTCAETAPSPGQLVEFHFRERSSVADFDCGLMHVTGTIPRSHVAIRLHRWHGKFLFSGKSVAPWKLQYILVKL